MAVMAWETANTGDPAIVGDKNLICTPEIYQACLKDGRHYGSSTGLFQIRYLPGRPDPSTLKDPETNIKLASEMLKAHKYHWSPTWTGATKQHIK